MQTRRSADRHSLLQAAPSIASSPASGCFGCARWCSQRGARLSLPPAEPYVLVQRPEHTLDWYLFHGGFYLLQVVIVDAPSSQNGVHHDPVPEPAPAAAAAAAAPAPEPAPTGPIVSEATLNSGNSAMSSTATDACRCCAAGQQPAACRLPSHRSPKPRSSLHLLTPDNCMASRALRSFRLLWRSASAWPCVSWCLSRRASPHRYAGSGHIAGGETVESASGQ